MRVWRAGSAVLGSAAAMVAVTGPAPAQAASSSYVAMGDSYSSGTGTRSYISDGTSCQRSVLAYPSLVSAGKGLDLNFRACSGSTVADVTNTQLSSLSTGTGHVTISVGGNDAGFAGVLTECAKPAWMSNCNAAIDRAQAYVDNTLPGRLDTLYGQMRSRAPQANVVVVGYPRIFNGEDCNAFTWFSPTEEARLNSMADRLNARTSSRAAAAGFTFSNPTTAFSGHAVCDDPEWINGLSSPVSESYHPNLAGHRGYAGVVSPSIGSPVPAATVSQTTLQAQSEVLGKQQRKHAAKDRLIKPKSFVAPDLHSAQARAAARAAGVDVEDRASVDAADRRYEKAELAARND